VDYQRGGGARVGVGGATGPRKGDRTAGPKAVWPTKLAWKKTNHGRTERNHECAGEQAVKERKALINGGG